MKLNTRSFGLATAITTAVLWSFYSLGNLALDVLVVALVDGADCANLSNFNWAEHINRYFAQVLFITVATGSLGWLTATIYNDINDYFSLKLK
jgi:hypothetical protein